MFGKLLESPRELLLRRFDALFGGDEWRPLLDFVSPTFFEVVPLRALLSQGRELVSNAADRDARTRTEAGVAEALAARGLDIRLERSDRGRGGGGTVDPILRGQRVLQLYFAQIFGADSAFVDLRHGSFHPGGGDRDGGGEPGGGGEPVTIWSPAAFFVHWDPEFLASIRGLYRGFYGGDEAAFDQALDRLDLTASKDLFERHFGDDPSAVRFDRGHFVATFHDVFTRCRERGVRLHRNFLPLGVYLASLHEHLGELGGGPFDVGSAYRRGATLEPS